MGNSFAIKHKIDSNTIRVREIKPVVKSWHNGQWSWSSIRPSGWKWLIKMTNATMQMAKKILKMQRFLIFIFYPNVSGYKKIVSETMSIKRYTVHQLVIRQWYSDSSKSITSNRIILNITNICRNYNCHLKRSVIKPILNKKSTLLPKKLQEIFFT